MSSRKTKPTRAKPVEIRRSSLVAGRPVGTGYEKGNLAKDKILESALRIFGTEGFKGATTRRIAEDAGVNIPALKYYFGGKDGLYIACAHEIVGRYVKWTAPATEEAYHALQSPIDAATARKHLKAVLLALTNFFLSSSEAQVWTLFVQRELASPSAAFDVLYSDLWKPGVDQCAALIAAIIGQKASPEEAHARALLLISSLLALNSGRRVLDRILSPLKNDDARRALIERIISDQIDRMGSA